MPERNAPRSVSDRVAAVANGALSLAGGTGLVELAASLSETARRWPIQEVTVVVAGEAARGKSSLINAVVGRESLLPVGRHGEPGALVAIRSGNEDRLTVRFRGGDSPVEAPLSALEEWVYGVRKDVDLLEVSLAESLLPAGVCIVDTPGFGEVTDPQREPTSRVLGLADVLIAVFDPSAPLSAQELAFISKAHRRIAMVMLVMTKVDQFGGWKQVLRDDLDLLERDRYAEPNITPVSARLALRSLVASDRVRAAAMLEDSGLVPVRDVVCRGLVGRSQLVRMSNLVRLSSCALDAAGDVIRDRLAGVEGEVSVETSTALEEERRRVEELRDSGTRYQTWLNDRFSWLREQLMNDVTIGIREVMDRYESVIYGYRNDPERMLLEARAAISEVEATATEAFAAHVRAAVAELASLVGENDQQRDTGVRTPARVDPMSLRVAQPVQRVDRLAMLRGVSTVGGLGTSLTFLFRNIKQVNGWEITAAMIGCFALTAIAGVGSLFVGARQRDVDQLRAKLRALGDAARTELGPVLRERAIVMQRGVEEELRSLLRERTRSYQGRLADAQTAQRIEASMRQKERQEVAQQMRDLDRLRAEADTLRDELDSSLAKALLRPEVAVMPDQRPSAHSYGERGS